MSFQPAPFYTRNSLARECGITASQIDRHIRTGTCRLDKATEKIPGIGIRINGPLARKFIEMMHAKKAAGVSTHVAI